MKQEIDQRLKDAGQSIDENRLSILSAAQGETDGRPVTRLALRDATGDLALIMVPDVLQLDGLGAVRGGHPFKLSHIGHWNSVAWTEGRHTLLLVANRAYEDLLATASRINFSSPGH